MMMHNKNWKSTCNAHRGMLAPALRDTVTSFVFHRLGVGAPIPEASASRNTARLRTQLTGGKKRGRNDDGEVSKQSQSSEDEEESRAAVMQKKVKLDPFGGGKKKQKNQVNGLFTPQHTPGSSQVQISQDISKASGEVEIEIAGAASPASLVLTTSSRKKKKKRKKALNVDSGAVELSSPPPTPERNSAHETQAAADFVAKDRVASPCRSVGPEPTRTPFGGAMSRMILNSPIVLLSNIPHTNLIHSKRTSISAWCILTCSCTRVSGFSCHAEIAIIEP
jgi:hypothetical protein